MDLPIPFTSATNMMGQSRNDATSYEDPSSFAGDTPSYSPITPSMTAMSLSFPDSISRIKLFLMPSFEGVKKVSRFFEGTPNTVSWKMGSI